MSTTRMTVDEYLLWAEDRPGRYELIDGRVFAMAPERARHAQTKLAIHVALLSAVRDAGVRCHVLPDGMAVRIERSTAYEPDALLYCGSELPGDAIEVPEPVIVVEVLSPSAGGTDKGAKLAGYFALPSICHYLIVDADRRLVVHHRRGEGDTIATRIVGSGVLRLEPPGIDLSVEAMLGTSREAVASEGAAFHEGSTNAGSRSGLAPCLTPRPPA